MFGELRAIANVVLFVDLNSGEPLSALWHILAILAVAGIVIVVGLAIIEPGPLVHRRPFSRGKRSRESETESDGRTSLDKQSEPASADGNFDQNEGS